MFKIIIFLCSCICLSFTFVLSTEQPRLVRITCTYNTTSNTCDIRGVQLTRADRRYEVVGNPVATTVVEVEGTLPVISRDFCDAFPNLSAIFIYSANVEILDQDAFVNCIKLAQIIIGRNKIQVVPEDIFRNNPDLTYLYLDNNQIRHISTKLFDSNPKLYEFRIEENNLSSFDVGTNGALRSLQLDGNDMIDLDVNALVQKNPSLQIIHIGDNMYPCSRVPALINTLIQSGITVVHSTTRRSRIFTMSTVQNTACVQGQ